MIRYLILSLIILSGCSPIRGKFDQQLNLQQTPQQDLAVATPELPNLMRTLRWDYDGDLTKVTFNVWHSQNLIDWTIVGTTDELFWPIRLTGTNDNFRVSVINNQQ